MFLIDAHLDLAMNGLHLNRDLTVPALETRRQEQRLLEKGRAAGTVSFPDMRRGSIGVCVATLIARVSRPGNPLPGYPSPAIAHAVARGQLAYYRQLEREGECQVLGTKADLTNCASAWINGSEQHRIGLVISMEGADPIVSPDHLDEWYNLGLRIIGLTHYGVSRYAHGTATEGGLLPTGKPLLKEMERLGMVLDVTHLADQSIDEALEAFGGRVLASHHNCRALVPGDRQLTDEHIKQLIARDAVIGAAFDAWMLYPGWQRGRTTREVVDLGTVVDHIDHVCQLAGNSLHSAIGTDLDGGYGIEQVPSGLNTIDELQKLIPILEQRGYSHADIENILYGNWLRLLQAALP